MSLYDDVEREALHDWLDQRSALLADAKPDRSEYEDPPAGCPCCGEWLDEASECETCGWPS
jgi:hypothetical protein